MVRLESVRELVENATLGGKVIHLHDLGVGEDVKMTYILVRGPDPAEVYDVLRSMQVKGWMSGGDFIGEYLGESVVCGDSCPKIDIIWKYKTWNAKWEEDPDAEGRFVCEGKLLYKDMLYGEQIDVPVRMQYVVSDDGIWTVDFLFGGEQFKKLEFQSTSERYAKTKMLDVAQETFPLEFYRQESFSGMYGDTVVKALDEAGLLLEY